MNKQQGITFLGFIIAGVLAGLLLLATFRLIPVYMEYYNVTSILSSVADSYDDDDSELKIQREIREAINRKFEINNITHISASDVIIRTRDKETELLAQYQVKVPFIFNIAFLVQFNKTTVIDND